MTIVEIAEILEKHFPGAPSRAWLAAAGELATLIEEASRG